MVDDAILAREAALNFQNAYGFEPDMGNLMVWKGVVRDRSGQAVNLSVQIPPAFPNIPPEIYLPGGTGHAMADQNGRIMTRTTHNWRASNHVYQVIREARQAISSSNFSNAVVVNQQQQDDVLNRQIQTLKQQIGEREKEMHALQNMQVETSNIDPRQVAEESLLNVESDLYAIEEGFDRLEIDDVEFAKKFLQLRKRYYMIENAL